MTNVFKVRNGKETHVYRTETSHEKKTILSQFRQVAEELSQKRRKEREGEHERRKSMWQGGSSDGGSIVSHFLFHLFICCQAHPALSASPKHLYQNGWPILFRKVAIFPEWALMSKKRWSEMRVGLASGQTTLRLPLL